MASKLLLYREYLTRNWHRIFYVVIYYPSFKGFTVLFKVNNSSASLHFKYLILFLNNENSRSILLVYKQQDKYV